MKKFCLVLLFSVFSTLSFANNYCLDNIEKYVNKERGGKGFPYEFYLSMASCNLRDQDMPTIITFLQSHKDIYHLDLSDNLNTAKGAQILADGALEIASLALDNNDLGKAGARALSQFKAHPVSWFQTTLSLDRNNIRDAGAMALAENITFSSLHLEKNHIGNAGIIALAHNTSLLTILMNYNQITNTGALAFAHTTRLKRMNQVIQRVESGYITNLFLHGNSE